MKKHSCKPRWQHFTWNEWNEHPNSGTRFCGIILRELLSMKNLISAKLAGNILLASFGLLLIFHFLVLLGIIPAEILWGGQATSANLVMLELSALVLTIFFGLVIAAKTGYIKPGKFSGVVNVLTWVIFVFLLLNTLGNLASGVSAENFIFAPVTVALAFCALRLAIEK